MRVTNLLIGTTTLAIIVAAFVGMLSIQKLRSAHQRGPLRIVFDGSASGLRKGGAVNFDGVPAGEIVSIKLKSPHKIAALVMLDKTVPIRKDTAVGIEYQGLTGLAAISLVGGAPAAPPVPLDQDGVPVLTADWSEQQSIADTLHNVDKAIVDNEATLRDTLLSFETSTESLKSRGEAIDSVIDKAENSFASFDNAITRVDRVVPGLGDGNAGELFEKVKSIRELADSFRLKSATVMEEGRRSLLDISEAANRMGQKSDASAAASRATAPPRRQNAKRR
jgi:phospholipid/cholesterol/gamma-HCH transport system substrate-binding protein